MKWICRFRTKSTWWYGCSKNNKYRIGSSCCVSTLLMEGTCTYYCICHLTLILVSWSFDLNYFRIWFKIDNLQELARHKSTTWWFPVAFKAFWNYVHSVHTSSSHSIHQLTDVLITLRPWWGHKS
jgi:hypothetical protein